MAKILLDYVFPITVITPTPQAATGFLKQACLVCKPKAGQEGNVGEVYECANMAAVAARTDNDNAQQLFNAGMNKVFILLSDDLDLEDALGENLNSFYTVLVSDDFDDDDIGTIVTSDAVPAVKATKKIQDILYTAKTGGVGGNSITVTYVDDGTAGAETVGVASSAITVHMEAGVSTAAQIAAAITASTPAAALVDTAVDAGDESDVQADIAVQTLTGGVDLIPAVEGEGDGVLVGEFKGVVGVSSDDADVCASHAAIENRCAFFTKSANGAKNMCFAFGTLLANPVNWLNQQFITMPVNDDVAELGDAESLFDDKVSFVIHDDEFGNRLALFCAGGKAIIAAYILKNLRIDMQSRALSWISGNQPQYTKVNASLLETRIQEDVINLYILVKKWIEAGTIEITLEQDNFVASGAINVAEPKALWRVFNEMRQTL